jgi:hypothetical protein
MKFKIFKITHYRCGDYDNTTNILGPEDTTVEQFESDIIAAQKDYLEAIDDFDKNYKDIGYPKNSINEFPDNLTIAECKKLNKESEEKRKEMQILKGKATGSFENYLCKRGYFYVWDEKLEAIEMELDWGHKHGAQLKYGN